MTISGSWIFLLVLTAGVMTSANKGWSWGEEKSESTVKGRIANIGSNVEERSREVRSDVAPAVLPLEEHDVVDAASSLAEYEGGDNREGRFLGIRKALCEYDILNCKEDKKRVPTHYGTKKVDRYQAFPPTNYGAPTNSFGSSYSSYGNQNHVAYSDVKGPYPLPNSFGNAPKEQGFFQSLMNTFIPEKKPDKSIYGPPPFEAPVVVNSYRPPINIPNPSYDAPKVYPTDVHRAPSYTNTKPHVPVPSYHVPKPTYQKEIPAPVIRHGPSSVVQHIHQHTHIYNQNGPPAEYKSNEAVQESAVDTNNAYLSKDGFLNQQNSASGLEFHKTHNLPQNNRFEKDISSVSVFAQTLPNANNKPSSSSFSQPDLRPFHEGGFKVSSPNFQNINTGFKDVSTAAFQGSSSSQFQNNVGSTFQSNLNSQFQNSNLNINDLSNSAFQVGVPQYREDCQCIPAQYCAREDIVPRTSTKDISSLIDARTKQDQIFSNDTDFESELNYDEATDSTTEVPEYEVIYALDDSELNQTRTKREADVSSNDTAIMSNDRQGRQLTGFTPGLNGCGPDHICCRRPIYVAPRTLPGCGKGNVRAIHGRVLRKKFETGDTQFGEYPWQSVILRRNNGELMYECGATLIDDRHVLTAAHCITELEIRDAKIRLGEWDVNKDSEFYTHMESEIANVYVHPDYYSGNLENDVAVIKLQQPVDFTKNPHIRPVCLPDPHIDYTNHKCYVTGFGKDSFGDIGEFQHIMKEVEVPVLSRSYCQSTLQGTRLGPGFQLHKGMMCAGGEEGRDACQGDGGGPMVCPSTDGSFQLVGLVSWGIGCGQRGVPGVYVKVSHYLDWIQSVTGN